MKLGWVMGGCGQGVLNHCQRSRASFGESETECSMTRANEWMFITTAMEIKQDFLVAGLGSRSYPMNFCAKRYFIDGVGNIVLGAVFCNCLSAGGTTPDVYCSTVQRCQLTGVMRRELPNRDIYTFVASVRATPQMTSKYIELYSS
jgi:hypothetical protein